MRLNFLGHSSERNNNVKTHHETSTVPMTTLMTEEKGHQPIREYLEILKDRSRYEMLGVSMALSVKVCSEALSGSYP